MWNACIYRAEFQFWSTRCIDSPTLVGASPMNWPRLSHLQKSGSLVIEILTTVFMSACEVGRGARDRPEANARGNGDRDRASTN